VQLGLKLVQQRREHPCGGNVGPSGRGQGGEHGTRERGQRGLVHRQAVGVEHRASHPEPQRALVGEPLREDRDHVAPGLDSRRDGLDQDVGVLGRGRFRHRVDPALRAEKALGLDAEDEDHRGVFATRVLAGPGPSEA